MTQTERIAHLVQLAEGATRAARMLDRFNATPAEGDKATAQAGEHWNRVLDELIGTDG